jgi:hypothetical protein
MCFVCAVPPPTQSSKQNSLKASHAGGRRAAPPAAVAAAAPHGTLHCEAPAPAAVLIAEDVVREHASSALPPVFVVCVLSNGNYTFPPDLWLLVLWLLWLPQRPPGYPQQREATMTGEQRAAENQWTPERGDVPRRERRQSLLQYLPDGLPGRPPQRRPSAQRTRFPEPHSGVTSVRA